VTSVTAAGAALPPLPPQRGTNNAPIFD
jgi:hypothetical protein